MGKIWAYRGRREGGKNGVEVGSWLQVGVMLGEESEEWLRDCISSTIMNSLEQYLELHWNW